MLLEGSLSSTLFALGSQAEIYYGWKPLQLSDVSAGLRELKISAEINSMSCDFAYVQQLQWDKKKKKKKERKKARDHSFILHLWVHLVQKKKKKVMTCDTRKVGNFISTEYNPDIWNADIQDWQSRGWHFDVKKYVRLKS